MTIEAVPFGNSCDLSCTYCYYTQAREAGNFGSRRYDLDRMLAGIEAEVGGWTPSGQAAFVLHGGDPLQLPLPDLERVWKWGYEKWGANGVQTHGAKITPAHVALAKRYNAAVGISIDGPGALNDLRWAGSLERTREWTANSQAAIRMLCEAGVSTSVIVVLHKLNMAPDSRQVFKDWLRELEDVGVRSIRLHTLEVDSAEARDRYLPTEADAIAFYRDMHDYLKTFQHLRVDLMQDMRYLLTGKDAVLGDDGSERGVTTCTFNACDPLTTPAVHGVDGQGVRSNCGRVNKDGVPFPKSEGRGYERYIALYHTPQEYHGCQDCRFFFACKGQCPGEGVASDWRNKSEHCGLYYALFETVEQELLDEGVTPLSVSAERVVIEQRMLDAWAAGASISIARALRGGYTPQVQQAHGDSPHGDSPHGDSHGDHTDSGAP
jgi:uncharacterized protein